MCRLSFVGSKSKTQKENKNTHKKGKPQEKKPKKKDTTQKKKSKITQYVCLDWR
jgi:hypothetical protein